MRLTGGVAVVTGGNGGLGRYICAALAEAGMHIAVVCRKSLNEAEAVAADLTERHGVRAQAFAADTSSAEEVPRLRAAVLAEFGGVEVLVNNAALNQMIDFDDLDSLTPEIWEKLMRINSTGPFLCAREFAPALRAGDGGRIVNVSSIAGFAPMGSSIAYAVSKAALNHLTRCLAVALAPDVLVNAVAPGYMEGTRMSARQSPERIARNVATSALRRPTSREDVAAQIVAFARSDSTTGQVLCVDAGRYFH